MQRAIVGFHQDAHGDWIAELSCGHRRHVRHRPPFEVRPWVVDAEVRRRRLGTTIACGLCAQGLAATLPRMRVTWFGQSAFLLEAAAQRVVVDPFPDMTPYANRLRGWRYPPIQGIDADLVLITHDHIDHNGAAVVGGEPAVIAKAGTHESPVGTVVGVSSEHDAVAGTQRGQNTIFRFELEGTSVAHFGDFGQPALRPEQREALGAVDVVFFPAGGGPTTPVDEAAALVRELAPRVVVPMHFRTDLIGFLDPVDPFLDALGADVERLGNAAELGGLLDRGETVVALLDPPRA